MAVQRLTAAYRSRPRPSSTPGAKASTVCSYYLDGEFAHFPPRCHEGVMGLFLTLGLVQFSRSTEATDGCSARGLSKLSSVDPARLE
jgi:hypothetical protein